MKLTEKLLISIQFYSDAKNMFEIYLAFLVFGGLLLAGSLIFGSESHTDADVHSGVDLHISDTHPVAGETHSIEHYAEGKGVVEAIKFVSFRNFIYFSTFFGLTGTLLTLFEIALFLSLPLSILVGGISGYAGYRFMKYLKSSESGEIISMTDLVGRIAEVTLNVFNDKPGKVKIEFGGKFEEFIAILSEESQKNEYLKGEKVLVIDIANNKLIVTDFEIL